jgi:hypothetical protein
MAMANTMPIRPKPSRKRPVTIRIATSVAERKELRRAAIEADMPLSTLVRVKALAAVRGELKPA